MFVGVAIEEGRRKKREEQPQEGAPSSSLELPTQRKRRWVQISGRNSQPQKCISGDVAAGCCARGFFFIFIHLFILFLQ